MSSPDREFYEGLLAELSASGSEPIVDPQGNSLTLRGAVRSIFDKIRTIYRLDARPLDPRRGDDLYGHILSLRAEGLITQHMVAAMADKLGLDSRLLYQQAKDGLK